MSLLNCCLDEKSNYPRANQMNFAGRVIEKDGIRHNGLHQFFSGTKPPLILPARSHLQTDLRTIGKSICRIGNTGQPFVP
jgi:hypothetical protein